MNDIFEILLLPIMVFGLISVHQCQRVDTSYAIEVSCRLQGGRWINVGMYNHSNGVVRVFSPEKSVAFAIFVMDDSSHVIDIEANGGLEGYVAYRRIAERVVANVRMRRRQNAVTVGQCGAELEQIASYFE